MIGYERHNFKHRYIYSCIICISYTINHRSRKLLRFVWLGFGTQQRSVTLTAHKKAGLVMRLPLAWQCLLTTEPVNEYGRWRVALIGDQKINDLVKDLSNIVWHGSLTPQPITPVSSSTTFVICSILRLAISINWVGVDSLAEALVGCTWRLTHRLSWRGRSQTCRSGHRTPPLGTSFRPLPGYHGDLRRWFVLQMRNRCRYLLHESMRRECPGKNIMMMTRCVQ